MHSDGTISIRVNGEHRRVPDGISLYDLASEIGLSPENVAVEHNLDMVPRATLRQVKVQDGDELEIMQSVGGDHGTGADGG